MTDNWFTDVDFSETSYDNHFKQAHDPDQAYDHIQFLHDTLDYADDEDIKASAQVNLFRACMQYTEEFLIYLAAHLNPETSFVNDLIDNDPRRFAKNHLENNHNHLIENQSFDFEEQIKSIFCYTEMLEEDDLEVMIDGNKIPADELEDHVGESLTNFYSYIEFISHFYYTSIDMYNAVKHGNKYQITHDMKIEFMNGEDEYSYQPDQSFATFLCKYSGDTAERQPYIANCPLDFLVARSLSAANVTHLLLTKLKAVTNQETVDDEENISCFFAPPTTPQDPDDTDLVPDTTYVEFWNFDTKNIIPKPEDLATFISRSISNIAVRITVHKDKLQVQTQRNEETSEDYPIEATMSFTAQPGPKLEFKQSITFTVDRPNLDVAQYSALRQWKQKAENNEFRYVEICFENVGECFSLRIGNLDPIEVEDLLSIDEAKGLARAQNISDKYMPLPPVFHEDQVKEIIEVAANDPETEAVDDAIERAQALRKNEHCTEIWAESPSEEGVKLLGIMEGYIVTPEQGQELDDEQPDLVGIGVEDQTIPCGELDASYEQYLENVRQFPEVALMASIRPPEDSAEDRDTCSVEVDVEYNIQDFWYLAHRATIRRTDQESP